MATLRLDAHARALIALAAEGDRRHPSIQRSSPRRRKTIVPRTSARAPLLGTPTKNQAPTWSPTGDRLAFERFRRSTGHLAIFTVRLDGTGLRRIPPWRLDASQPDRSPNGRWIAFRTQETSDRRGDIALVRPSGNRLHIITSGSGKWQSCSFSPNGKRITAGHAPGHGAAGNADVYTMKVDGTDLQNVTNSNRWESAPDWGPRPT